MDISKQLSELLEKYQCTAKELAEESELSVSVISRYRKGERTPSSKQLEKLIKGFDIIAQKRGMKFDSGEISYQSEETDKDIFIRRFNILVSTLDVNMNDFARYFNYDPSFISRVRSKQRSISDIESFARKTGEFISLKYNSEEHERMVMKLTGTEENFESQEQYAETIQEWLCSSEHETEKILERLSDNLKDIDMQEYFVDKPLITSESVLTKQRVCGNDETVCRGEIEFLREVLKCQNTEEIFLFNEMPHLMFSDDDFSEEWLFLMWGIIKKGIKINIIHKIDRSFNDMILAFEKMMPLYLTGKVQAYYISSSRHNSYYHICNYCREAVMYGTGMYKSEHANFVISKDEKDIEYGRAEIEILLEKARPLINVYTKQNEKIYHQFIRADVQTAGERAGMFCVMPLYTMTEELLLRILSRNGAEKEETEKILEGYREMRESTNNILKTSKIQDFVSIMSEEEFKRNPVYIMNSYVFPEKNYSYSYEEYLEHQQQAEEFAQNHTNYSIKLTKKPYFNNINVIMHKDKWVVVARTGSPASHLVIRHPYMIRVVENITFLLSAE